MELLKGGGLKEWAFLENLDLPVLLELRIMEVVVTTGAIRRAKLQLNYDQQQTSVQLSTGWMPFLSPNQQCESTEGKVQNIFIK